MRQIFNGSNLDAEFAAQADALTATEKAVNAIPDDAVRMKMLDAAYRHAICELLCELVMNGTRDGTGIGVEIALAEGYDPTAGAGGSDDDGLICRRIAHRVETYFSRQNADDIYSRSCPSAAREFWRALAIAKNNNCSIDRREYCSDNNRWLSNLRYGVFGAVLTVSVVEAV